MPGRVVRRGPENRLAGVGSDGAAVQRFVVGVVGVELLDQARVEAALARGGVRAAGRRCALRAANRYSPRVAMPSLKKVRL